MQSVDEDYHNSLRACHKREMTYFHLESRNIAMHTASQNLFGQYLLSDGKHKI